MPRKRMDIWRSPIDHAISLRCCPKDGPVHLDWQAHHCRSYARPRRAVVMGPRLRGDDSGEIETEPAPIGRSAPTHVVTITLGGYADFASFGGRSGSSCA